ncbi:peptidase G2 autoproteolytic cleavage domain-containing protein [Tritonibacter horizontis]|uniref:Peptidase G2 IMC autoproteolytic cleavage domain-containing protein n=1 Tax=Tritonibacter horizontis TaxID=1768241 RepID=A0A132BTT1_9RHOB|nr:peptidase G2 autoproteolytic cleavage domain-containing protein [Tritonibacter horizontis]KUP91805.1 hypothetical protein TRIHO_33360 [Tritonibacter horizontis]
MPIPTFSEYPEIPQRSTPEAEFDAKMYALFQHLAITNRNELLAFIAFLETNSTVIGAALNGTTIGLNTPAAGAFTDLEAESLGVGGAASFGDSVVLQDTSDASYLRIQSQGDALFDIDPITVDETSRSAIRLFRDTDTTGEVTFDVLQGNNSAGANHRLGGNVDSYLCKLNGNLSVGTDNVYDKLSCITSEQDRGAAYLRNTNASFSHRVLSLWANRTGSPDFQFLRCVSNASGTPDVETYIGGDGDNMTDGSWGSTGADYAEYFEWLDGNPTGEDRRGMTVVLDGAKIRPALAGEDPIGVISANPSVVGDSDIDRWKGKYLRDDFGAYIWEDYQVTDPETGETVTQQRRCLNPEFDPAQAYQPRSARPEWDMVGLLGKLRLRTGQPVGARWIRMRDVSAEVEDWLVR